VALAVTNPLALLVGQAALPRLRVSLQSHTTALLVVAAPTLVVLPGPTPRQTPAQVEVVVVLTSSVIRLAVQVVTR